MNNGYGGSYHLNLAPKVLQTNIQQANAYQQRDSRGSKNMPFLLIKEISIIHVHWNAYLTWL